MATSTRISAGIAMIKTLVLLVIFGLFSQHAAGGQSVSLSSLTFTSVSTRVQPGQSWSIKVNAQVPGVAKGSVVTLLGIPNFATDFPSITLTQTANSGSTFTLSGSATAPNRVGFFKDLSITWTLQVANNKKVVTDTVSAGSSNVPLDVSCSDGIFCNGEERFIGGKCVTGLKPCHQDDTNLCNRYQCIEATKTCSQRPVGTNCANCTTKKCHPKCGKNTCGEDGCGGSCGTCANNLSCISGICTEVVQPGTCSNPLPLFGADGFTVPSAGIQTVVLGDNSGGVDEVRPDCNGYGVPELIYRFDVAGPSPMGFEIQMLAQSGNPDDLDTVLAVQQSDCKTTVPIYSFCSDDATPPGGTGSRVFGLAQPGTYYLVATGYASVNIGLFQLKIKFYENCIPTCEAKFCGPDGCGGTCGNCDTGFVCNDLAGRCLMNPCVPDCHKKKCGDDGCGGSCGSCKAGSMCADRVGTCEKLHPCDHFAPTCPSNRKPTNGPDYYCGTDCQWYARTQEVIDLVPNPKETVIPSIVYEWRNFDSASCALFESCVEGTGNRLLMRFDTQILNIALVGFKPPPAATNPEYFEWSSCHQHYHFEGFAEFALYFADGTLALPGRKRSYCMEDSAQHLFGPSIACDPESSCANQGIQGGWSDTYPSVLDCQWLDLTDNTKIPKNTWYWYEVCTNTMRLFHEHSFDNNCVRFPVYIPSVPAGTAIKYTDMFLPSLPAGMN